MFKNSNALKKTLNALTLSGVLVLLTLSGCTSENVNAKSDASTTKPKTIESSKASQKPKTLVVLQTTQGDLELELFIDIAPRTVENFITHVKNGYYDGIAFHRIIKNFMIQGGDPTETGRGGESIWGKKFKDEYKNKTFERAGILAMANSGPNTNGSQFFITTSPTPWLNGYHTIFGQITASSMSTLQKLNNVKTEGRSGADKPIERQEILKAYVKETK